MNDQQSPPVPDPQSQSSSQETEPAVAPSSGLSDQEAFLMLAMSMSGKDDGPEAWARPADSTLEADGWAIDAGATIGGGDRPPESVDGEESPAGDQFDESTDVVEAHHEADTGGSTIHDALGEIDLRDHVDSTAGGRGQSPFLSALADRLRGRGGRVVWGANSSTDDTWEISGDLEDIDHGPMYGRVTEIVDLSTVPVPPDRSSVGTGGTGPVPAPRRSLLRPPEVPDLELPPLVFLDTRGDIVPSIRAIEPDQGLPARVVVDWGEFEPAESAPAHRTDRYDADRDDAGPDDANDDLGPMDETAVEEYVSPHDVSEEDGRNVVEVDRGEFETGALDEAAA
ncbi:MAG: hypothetical protein OER95_10645, partial [Acidimicrobiia bacterium]|nr:hypothetical protein [Acidimicrobiia bacterium]